MDSKLKRIGWVGYTDDKPFFENVTDSYVEIYEDGVKAANVYKSKKEAKKRFEDVRPVFILQISKRLHPTTLRKLNELHEN